MQTDNIANPKPLVTAAVNLDRVEPGEMVELSVVVEKKWAGAKVAGFAIIADSTTVMNALEPDTHNVGPMQSVAMPYALGHKQARMLTDGRATFRGQWVAPAATGSYDFQIFGVVSDDGDGKDDEGVFQEQNDPFEQTMITVGVGCTLSNYYEDMDKDGYGATLRRSCAPIARHVELPGDCDDAKPEVNPGATELCSRTDENCDGEAMTPLAQYVDKDGDGVGSLGDGLNLDACELLPGYSSEFGDCDPSDASVYPGAPEAPNGKDDNCDSKTDEAAGGGGGAPPIVGPGGSGGAATGGGAPVNLAPLQETSEGGCQMVAAVPSSGALGGAWLAALGLCAALFRRRRS
jgi:MYXO-CTERM domain-containing protein